LSPHNNLLRATIFCIKMDHEFIGDNYSGSAYRTGL
jgi:hypothetical protein